MIIKAIARGIKSLKNLFSDLQNSISRKTISLLSPFYPCSPTPKQDILALISALKPVTTEHKLIRMGAKADGGYLVPDDLEGITACFSPGVSNISDFELDCANMGMQVFLADHSVNNAGKQHPNFHFTQKFIGFESDESFISLQNWMNSTGIAENDDLILQMDIEGYEYENILMLDEEYLKRFRIIVIEFHHLDQLWSPAFFAIANRAFQKLLKTHICVHNHPNNIRPIYHFNGVPIPPLAELSFIRKDRCHSTSSVSQLPHRLDKDNCKRKKTSVLPGIWYR